VHTGGHPAGRVLAQVAQAGCGFSVLGDIQKLYGYGPRQLALGGPAWAGDVWT